jgi:phosphatidylglycerophosphatase C
VSRQALFDFDGTITSKDTTGMLLSEMLKLRPWRAIGVMWFLVKMVVSNDSISKQRYKNRSIGHLIVGLTDLQLSPALEKFRNKVKALYRPSILKAIDQTVQSGCTVLIVTASPTFAIDSCTSELPAFVLGTEFERRGGIYTGRLHGENCYGHEKVNRLYEWTKFNNTQLNVESAWSDHFSDLEMLKLSKERYWIGGEQLRKLMIDRDPLGNFVSSEG